MSAQTGLFAEAAKWISGASLKLPDKLWRILYTKHQGGDFLHVNLFLPGSDDHGKAKVWGRAATASLQPMVTRNTSQAALPPLP